MRAAFEQHKHCVILERLHRSHAGNEAQRHLDQAHALPKDGIGFVCISCGDVGPGTGSAPIQEHVDIAALGNERDRPLEALLAFYVVVAQNIDQNLERACGAAGHVVRCIACLDLTAHLCGMFEVSLLEVRECHRITVDRREEGKRPIAC